MMNISEPDFSSTPPKAIHMFFFLLADSPHIPHIPSFRLRFCSCSLLLLHFAGLHVFAAWPALIRMFRILYGLNIRKSGMIGFVRDGFGCSPSLLNVNCEHSGLSLGKLGLQLTKIGL